LWRAGRLSIGYQEERDLLLLEVDELLDEDTEDVAEEQEGLGGLEELEGLDELERRGERLRLWASPEQMLSLSRHGAMVCARGRPACQFCGNPLDPEGHVCPAMNGHGPPAV